MAKAKAGVNPFYVLLVLVGVVFFVTAFAYGVMAFRADRLGRTAAAQQKPTGLMAYLDEHGGQLLTWELLALAVATTAAIGSDSYWSRRHERRQAEG
jgi:hypothetical protein